MQRLIFFIRICSVVAHGRCRECYATLSRYCRNYAHKTQKRPCRDAGARRTAPRTARFDGFVRHRSSSSIISYSILAEQRSTRGKLCVPVGQPGLAVIYSRKISSEVKMQIPRCQVLQAQYLWHGLRFLRMPCLQRPLQFSPKGV